MRQTSLSAGLIIRDALAASDVADLATKIYPVVAYDATLPYVTYRCVSAEQAATKAAIGSDTVRVCVACYAATYAGCVEMAERVRAALDYARHEAGGLLMRSCLLADTNDSWEDDAFVKELIFIVKI